MTLDTYANEKDKTQFLVDLFFLFPPPFFNSIFQQDRLHKNFNLSN